MGENDVDAAVLKRTQQMLGKYVKKPALSEKLLRKPPFRFLHDVFNVVIKETGCFQGLYTADELNFESIKDRDDKMNFLKKMIDVIKITTGNTLNVRASKIVCGHEPEKTNELLQQIAEVIDKKLDWQHAVQQVNNNKNDNSIIPTETAAETKDATKAPETKRKAEKVKDNTKTKDTKSSTKTISPKAPKEEKKPKRATPTGGGVKDAQKTAKDKERGVKEKSSKGEGTKEKRSKESKGGDGDKTKLKSKETKQKTPSPSEPPAGQSEQLKPPLDEAKVATAVPPTAELVGEADEKSATIINSTAERNTLSPDELTLQQLKAETLDTLPAVTNEAATIVKRKSSGKRHNSGGSRRASATKAIHEEPAPSPAPQPQPPPPELPTPQEVQLKSPPHKVSEPTPSPAHHAPVTSSINDKGKTNPEPLIRNSLVQRESTFTRDDANAAQEPRAPARTTLRPPSARPASARPGAPRKRNRNVEIVLQPNDEVKTDAGINVKLESFGDFGDDDVENLVIIDDGNNNDNELNFDLHGKKMQGDDPINITSTTDDFQQGHLVQQILETQKELVQQTDNNNELDKQQERNSAGGHRPNAQQMDNLRDVIQNLTKAVNPFGKIIDFLPEDIDAMQLEMGMWRDAYQQAAVELKRERSLTESVTEPMKTQLTQIEGNIAEYAELIDASRMKILQNSEKILKMLSEQ